jgi:single-stranded-DNA-specific exonuclease
MNRYGGHAMAAGFELPAGLIPELRSRLERTAREVLFGSDLQPAFTVDTEAAFQELDEPFEKQFALFEPIGYGNSHPLFITKGVRLAQQPRVLKEKHVKLRLEHGGRYLTALAWNKAEEMDDLREGDRIDLIYSLFFNNWRNEKHLELEVKAFRQSGEK